MQPTSNVHALAGFLDCISFDFFCTFTSRKPESVGSIRRQAENVYTQIKSGVLFTGDFDVSMFWCAEKFDLTDGMKSTARLAHPEFVFDSERYTNARNLKDYTSSRYHWHALIKANVDKFQLFDYYSRRYGRCQIIDNREPDRQLAASYYCSKYVTKQLADYDIHLSSKHRK